METNTPSTITLQGPFDSHGHLRRGPNPGDMMHTVIPDVIAEFGGMIIMPNPEPPITDTKLGLEYIAEVESATPPDTKMNWRFMCYLTDQTDYDDVLRGVEEEIWDGLKYMPANGSTNTSRAVTDLEKLYPLLERVQGYGIKERRRKRKIPVALHGEVVGDDIDPFDAERIFVDLKLPELQKQFPDITFILEHISTKEAAWYVRDQPYGPIFATLTPQHALYTRKRIFQSGHVANGTFRRGLYPSMVCWPLLKEEADREAILELIVSGAKNIGAGSDRAPHPQIGQPELNIPGKLGECGAGGCYPERSVLGMYARAFESVGALEHLPDFACRNIPCGVYELPQGEKIVKLVKTPHAPYRIREKIGLTHGHIVPMMHGEKIEWRVAVETAG